MKPATGVPMGSQQPNYQQQPQGMSHPPPGGAYYVSAQPAGAYPNPAGAYPVGVPPPQQHYQSAFPPVAQGQFSKGLLDCFDDVPLCCLSCWCPCITFGRNAEIIDRGASSCGVSGALYTLIAVLTGLHCIYACTYRTKLKLQYGMPQDSFEDFCIHCWCHECALVQEYRELESRGFNVPLGWYGNMETMNQQMAATNPPGVHGGMTR